MADLSCASDAFPRVLIVDDSAPVRLWLSKTLSTRFCIREAPSLAKARTLLKLDIFDLILIDASLPDGSGLDFCRHLRSQPATSTVPILMITAAGEDAFIADAFAAGCSDFVRKPIRPPELLARIDLALKLQSAMQRIDRLIVELKERSERDPLTGLFNRHALYERTRDLLAESEAPLGAVMIDIDHFKECNDALGHLAGDALLVRFAHALQEAIPPEGIAARYGGDEFVVLLPRHDAAQMASSTESIWKALTTQKSTQVPIQCSMGFATMGSEPRDGFSPEQLLTCLLSQCDANLYRAKRQGRNQFCGPAECSNFPQGAS